MKRFRLTIPPYALATALVWASVWLGLTDAWPAVVMSCYTVAGLLAFNLLLSSPFAMRQREPMLVFPQVIYSLSNVALTFAWIPSARAAALQWLCLILVFDMRRLRRHETWIAAALAIVLPMIFLAVTNALFTSRLPAGEDLIVLGLSGLLTPVLLMVSAAGRALRKHQIQQKEQWAKAVEQLHRLSIRDGLTGLYNRRHMLSLLENEEALMRAQGRHFCVAILDIDRFKQTNDDFGHAVGDDVLRQFARLGHRACAGGDQAIARWGGEEFLVLVPGAGEERMSAVLSRLRAMVHAHDWSALHQGLGVSFSAGWAVHIPARQLEHTLEIADKALYRAKHTGRDRIEPAVPISGQHTDGHDEVAELELFQTDPSVLEVIDRQASGSGKKASPPIAKAHWRGQLARLAMGDDPWLQRPLRLCLATAGIYASVVWAIVFLAIPLGHISPEVGQLHAINEALAGTVPFLLVRLGLTKKWQDPSLALPQILWAFVGIGTSYVATPVSRFYVLQALCLCVAFGFVSLRPRETIVAGVGGVLMLLVVGCILRASHTRAAGHGEEWLQLTCAAIVIGFMTIQSRNFSLAREGVAAQRLELKESAAHIQTMLSHDPLTGLFNRQKMLSLLNKACEHQRLTGAPFSVALLDLDHFKSINDRYGHHVGDEALIGFAKGVQGVLRDSDIVGRWGGEEFLVLLSEQGSADEADATLERLRQCCEALRPCASQPDIQLTFSAGITGHWEDETWTVMLERADRALYLAKTQGRNRCVYVSSDA